MSMDERILEKLTAMEQRLVRLEDRLKPLLPGTLGQKKASPQFNVFFDITDSPRKPVLFKTQGILSISEKLSSMRAAILMMCLLDLQDRCEGGRGVTDLPRAIQRAYQQLEPEADTERELSENVRVAIYRFGQFCKDEPSFSNADYVLWFDEKSERLEILEKRTQRRVESLSVQISTTNSKVAAVLDQTLATSPIAKARKRKALHVPAGPEGADQFLLEMYDHDYQLEVTSLYVRPPFQSYPQSLLDLIGVSEKTMQRRRLAFEGYKSRKFRFVEILSEQTMWELIRYSDELGFKHYPKSVHKDLVLEHLDNLIHVLETYEQYNLYLTGLSVPFALVTYEIQSGPIPEYFTVFFQSLDSAASRDLGCFVLYDPLAYQSITENIINWIVTHPTTIRERGEVVSKIREVREYLATKGPLPYD